VTPGLYWAAQAWVGGRWQAAVLLRADATGYWAEVRCGVAAPPQATVLKGPVLPGLVNAHSHAFQRAFAGLSERRETEADDFWSWRDRMYRVALSISPQALRAVAAQLYGELLCGGFTQVCEFHYLQHQPDGMPYEDPACMSLALMDAATEAGIGLTLLPVLYECAGFNQPALRPDQRRFAADAAAVRALHQRALGSGAARVNAGVAIHSLRAATPASIGALTEALGDVPIHIHVAEQTGEVADCLATTGMRPIEWLTRHAGLDARWQLVHATHSTPAEIDAVARTGAGVVICPSTEANLGDGLADIPGWLAAGVPISIGTDSHVGRDAFEELRWLEYGQRLQRRQRNVAALPGHAEGSTAARLFNQAVQAGGRAAGFAHWGFAPGARADLLVLAPQAAALLGVPASHTLDAAVFSGGGLLCEQVMVAGQWRVQGGLTPDAALRAERFSSAMQGLWQAPGSASP
jgi:formimidoylglutamate deiminase